MKTSTLLAGFAALSVLTSAHAAVYSIDAGTAVAAVGDNTSPNWSAAGINHFTAVAGSQNIVSISAVFGAGAPNVTNLVGGEAFTVVIWSDPDGNGNPSDAQVLSSAAGTITVFNDNVTFQTTPITPVGLTVGQSFFAGVYYQNYFNKFPGAVSGPGSPGESWVSFNATAPLNLNNLAAADAFGVLGTVVGQPGLVSMIRANGVPEPTAAAFAGLAALGMLRHRRA